MRKFCCLIEAGVTPMARSRNHVAWSKRETYICEFMWLVKSYSEASTAPLNVCTHSDIVALRLSLFVLVVAIRRQLLELDFCVSSVYIGGWLLTLSKNSAI